MVCFDAFVDSGTKYFDDRGGSRFNEYVRDVSAWNDFGSITLSCRAIRFVSLGTMTRSGYPETPLVNERH